MTAGLQISNYNLEVQIRKMNFMKLNCHIPKRETIVYTLQHIIFNRNDDNSCKNDDRSYRNDDSSYRNDDSSCRNNNHSCGNNNHSCRDDDRSYPKNDALISNSTISYISFI